MIKNDKKIIIFILISLIIILTLTPASSNYTTLTNDQIDQEQTDISGLDYIYFNHWKAQSFKPTTKTLTRIKLYINKIGNINSDFEILIRDSLIGINLTKAIVSSSQIPLTTPEWIEFNFNDINVVSNKTYYIICKTSAGDQTNSYNWYESNNNPYERGTKYYSDDNGKTWQQNTDIDFCFKTYGQIGELYIQYIKGGFGWNIFYGIKNIGNLDINDINVYISFSGGLILTEKTLTDNINQSIAPNQILDKTISPIIGFGPTTITFTVSSPDAISTSKTVQGFLFLFSIYIHP